MRRHAFIIESSNVAGQKDLPGARVDRTSWVAHLTSKMGGAWNNGEIKQYNKPKWATLKSDLAAVRSGEYAFIAFSGHGYHAKSGSLNQSAIVLNEQEDIIVSNLITQGSWQLMCFDSCRGLETTLPPELIVEAAAVRAPEADTETYRRFFEQTVESADRICSIVYSCDIGEGANEDRVRGGIYTVSLHKTARNWHNRASNQSILSIVDAHQSGAKLVTNAYPQQHPQEELGRCRRYLPFAIRA